jgi:lactose/L-arabinose transport system substrate-binding protein
MRKKSIIASMLVILLTMSIIGCNKGFISNGSEGELKGTVTVWSTGESAKALRVAGDNFTKKHKQVKVIVSDIQNKELYEKLNAKLLSNQELPNIVSIESGRVASLVNKFPNKFLDLTNEVSPIKDKFLKSKLNEVTIKGKIMAFPWEAAPSALFYRRDIFQNIGIKAEDIKTWKDYIEAGKKIYNASNGKIKMLAFEEKKDDFLYNQLLNELGTWYFDKEGKPILSSDNSLKAMSIVKEIHDSNIVLNCQDVNSIVLAVQTGKIATLPYGTSFIGTLMEKCSSLKGKWGVMKLPAFEAGGKTASTLGGTTIMVTAVAENKKLIAEFAKFSATDSETLLAEISKNALFPSYLPIYEEPLFETSQDYFGGQKIWGLFSIIAKDIISRDFTENNLEVSENMKNVEVNILKGEELKKAMDDAEVNALKIFSK